MSAVRGCQSGIRSSDFKPLQTNRLRDKTVLFQTLTQFEYGTHVSKDFLLLIIQMPKRRMRSERRFQIANEGSELERSFFELRNSFTFVFLKGPFCGRKRGR